MTATTDLTTLTPIEIDTELARLWGEIGATTDRLVRTEGYLADARKGVKRGWTWEARDVDRYEAEIETLAAKLAELRADARPYEAEFTRRGGWLRYFLVTNNNGHVHREMNCHTCFPTTRYAWLIDLADCDEAAMIEEWGEKACTVCFADAPSNPNYNRPARVDREAAEARAKEKADREATKNAKAITDVDGKPLRTNYGTIRTKVAARNELSGAIWNVAWYGTHPTDFPGDARRLAAALRAGAPEIDVAKVAANALKRAKKDGADHLDIAEKLVKEIG
jgi:hypothetical protein